MADNPNDLEYQNEAYHEVKKSRFQAFKDFFNRQKALPESTESKHKTTSVDMKTSMSLTSFRASLVERVGNFFEALSKIGAPKKDENLNKFAKEVVGSPNKENTVERRRNDDENIVSQAPRYFPGDISLKNSQQAPSQGTIIIAETEVNNDLQYDSIDEGTLEIDEDFVSETTADELSKLEATTINVAKQPDRTQPITQMNKTVIIPKPTEKSTRKDSEEKDGPEL